MKFLKTYFKNIHDVIQQGDAREESFYSALEKLLLDYALATNRDNVHITVMPKKTEAGNPDFRIWDGKSHIVGYVEAKSPFVEYLDQIETTEQLQRYINTFPNVILTNFFEFRLYRNGRLIDRVLAAKPFVAYQLKSVPPVEKAQELLELFDQFFSFSLPKTHTAESLAVELAKRTRFLRDEVVAHELEDEASRGTGNIFGFYDAFRKFLLGRLTKDEFADLYAQTIVYGLFAARTRCETSNVIARHEAIATPNFTRRSAFDSIPQTIGILRDIFRYISLGQMSPQMESIIDDISELLAITDVKQIFRRSQDGKEDPVVHFYETFLAKYDPEERERRGVYYTPEPVVSYIVRSLNLLLKDKFGKADGLASEDVTLLDPAAGTMTFVAQACRLAIEEFTNKYGSGDKHGFIEDHLLENFYAFELMMAPYAVGHLKMSFFLEELGYGLQKNARFKFYLTNTLEMKELEQTSFPVLSSLSTESRKAGEIKRDKPVLVILGNPPYSGHSSNRGDWIIDKIDDYKQVDGKPLGEKNPKWLQDDYVKFIRFAEWKIGDSGEGVVGFITNHSYLDNPTFRGMRQHLMKSFDELYVLDLHGNSLKRETCPDGSTDRNVFDIRQGVAISFFVKRKDATEKRICHADLWGLRQDKYDWLSANDIASTDWKELHPHSEFYLFVPKREIFLDLYNQFPKMTEIFPLNGAGMTTARDHFVIDFDRRKLINRIRLFKNSKLDDDGLHKFFQIRKKKGWSIRRAWEMLQELSDHDLEQYTVPVLYRPFDLRWIFYHDSVIWRTVKRVMNHMMRKNFGLLWTRPMSPKYEFSVLCSTEVIDQCVVGNKSAGAGISYEAPLYFYPDTDRKDLFSGLPESQERKSNLNPELVKTLSQTYDREPTPEEIFHYIYGVLYSNTYREKYAEFLKIDFPRVPFTADQDLFLEIAALGKRLVELHLLRSAELDLPLAKFQGEGDKRVAKNKRAGRRYEPAEERVYINKDQYFEGVPQGVWEYQIGGYQVLDKWLKDRREKTLSNEEIRHYCRVVTALYKTIQIQKEIDARYPNIELLFVT